MSGRIAVVGFALLLAACGGEPAPPTSAAPPPARTPAPRRDHSAFIAAVGALAAEALQRGPIAGLSIAVQARGEEVLARGYGFTDVEARTPATADTSYPIASVSKRLTAAAILRLADQGRLSLDDPLSRFFPQARPGIGALTVRNLLQHTSGFTAPGPAPRHAAESVLARGGTAREQGQDWTYSNYNFSLLGLVIEKVSGGDYAAYVQDEIATPLGLKGTGYCEDGRALPGRGKDYLSTPASLAPTVYWSEARFFASGGLCSTVRDLVRFEEALPGGRVVSTALAAAMHSPTRLANGVEVDYGLGTRLGYTGTHRKAGHTGGGQGNKAVLARYPDDEVTIVVLANTERAGSEVNPMGIGERVARLFFGTPDPGREREAGAAARVAGEYRVGSRVARVRAEGAALVFPPGLVRGPARFVAEDGSTFVAEKDASREVRFWEEGGAVGGYRRYRHGWFTGFAVRADRPGEGGAEEEE